MNQQIANSLATAVDDAAIENEVELEKIRLLFRNTGIGQLVTIINAGALVFILGGFDPPIWALSWWVLMIAVAALRYGQARTFRAETGQSQAEARRWRKRAANMAFVSGLLWALGSAAMMIADPRSTRLFTALVASGMVAGALPLLSPVRGVFHAYTIPIGLAVAVTAIADAHGPNDWVLALVTVLFMTVMYKSSRHFNDRLGEATRLALITQAMARRLENSEQLFRTLAESTSTAIFTYRDKFVYVNPAGERLCGYSQDEMRELPFWAILHPDDRDEGRERGLRRMKGENIQNRCEYRFLTKNGETHWIEFHGALVTIDGLPTGLGSAFDITAHKVALEQLRESEAKFHTMVDWTHDWEYWTSPDGQFRYMTPSAERLTGYRLEEFKATPSLIDAIVHPEDRASWERHLHQHKHESGWDDTAEIELRIVRKSGETIWIHHACRPIYDSDGHYHGRRVTVRDISQHKAAEAEIRSLAYYDPLTHLPNRRLLMDRLGQALSASNRSHEFGALLILDLDNFKSLNDTRGHDVGDRLLIEAARRLSENVREQDTVSRLGGDEYVILLEELGHSEAASAGHAEIVAEKVRQALNQSYELGGDENDFRCTTSIGLTLFQGGKISAEVLLKQADVALYQAKDAGRNQVRFFNPDMQAAIEARIALESALRQGIERNEFELYYQPQVSLDGDLIGAEALIRWHSPERGLVSPYEFIPLAEDTGLILAMGEWVLITACSQLKDWQRDPRTRHLQIAVNVSARQFHQPDFVEQVRNALVTSGAEPGLLKLELTESVVLENVEEVIERMLQLNRMGVGFSLDDFGTGYSSLSYLKRLPIDQVKIDQSFVRDIAHDPNDAAIVRAILAMSHSLGLDAIAEGVENEAQVEFLRQNGCTSFQGYLFGRPMPIGQWHRLLKD